MEFFGIIFLAVIVEGLRGWAALFAKSKKICWSCVVAVLCGIAVCVGTGTDLFAMVGVPLEWPYVGSVLTGLLVSRGSDYIRSLTSRFTTDQAGETVKEDPAASATERANAHESGAAQGAQAEK